MLIKSDFMKIGILNYEFCKDEELCNKVNKFLEENNNIKIINIVIDFRCGYKIAKIIYQY